MSRNVFRYSTCPLDEMLRLLILSSSKRITGSVFPRSSASGLRMPALKHDLMHGCSRLFAGHLPAVRGSKSILLKLTVLELELDAHGELAFIRLGFSSNMQWGKWLDVFCLCFDASLSLHSWYLPLVSSSFISVVFLSSSCYWGALDKNIGIEQIRRSVEM